MPAKTTPTISVDGSVQQNLLRRVGDVIVAAHHVRDAHVDVVGNDGQLVRGRAVGADDDEVFDAHVRHGDGSVHEILERRLALGHAHAHDVRRARRFARGDLAGRQRRTRAIVHPRAAGGFRGRTLRLQLLRRAVAVVRVAGRDQSLREIAMAIEPLRLEVRSVRSANARALVPVEPEPPQAREDARHHVGRGTLRVGVLDAEDERSAVTSSVEPVEERGARAADVEIAGRARSEAGADRHDV